MSETGKKKEKNIIENFLVTFLDKVSFGCCTNKRKNTNEEKKIENFLETQNILESQIIENEKIKEIIIEDDNHYKYCSKSKINKEKLFDEKNNFFFDKIFLKKFVFEKKEILLLMDLLDFYQDDFKKCKSFFLNKNDHIFFRQIFHIYYENKKKYIFEKNLKNPVLSNFIDSDLKKGNSFCKEFSFVNNKSSVIFQNKENFNITENKKKKIFQKIKEKFFQFQNENQDKENIYEKYQKPILYIFSNK